MASMFARSRGRRTGAVLAAVMTFAIASCVGARSSASPPHSPGPSTTGSQLRQPSATPTTGPTSPASPSLSPATSYDLSNVPMAPTGEWKSIHWVAVSARPVAAPQSTDAAADDQPAWGQFKVAGWSRGFVGFWVQVLAKPDWTGDATIATTYSDDGVHWHDGQVLRQRISNDNLEISGVFEGPSGLLAVGLTGACADGWIEALWTSRDGATWQTVDTKKAFGNARIEDVSGGSSGFVATGETGRAVWTSRDGQSWRSTMLDTPAFARSRIDGGTAFSGGYVLVGSTEDVGARSCDVIIASGSAPPTPTPPLRSPAVWWSADGASWTKTQLPGATSAYSVDMYVSRAGDRTLIAWEDYNGPGSGSTLWVTNDGRNWEPLSQNSSLRTYGLLTDGRHTIQVDLPTSDANPSQSSEASISVVTGDGGLALVAQSGDRPPTSRPVDLPQGYGWQEEWAVGPTGILVTDGNQLWIGLPSQG